jgi:hypothetical protein
MVAKKLYVKNGIFSNFGRYKGEENVTFQMMSYYLSGEFLATRAQTEVVKIKKKIPTGLEVHLEDMI